MKNLILKNLPKRLLRELIEFKAKRDWRKRGCLENAPQFIKQNVFVKYGVPNAQWVETGTYIGTTTAFLSKNYSFVYSIEPEKVLYEQAQIQFFEMNVELFNDTSEVVFPSLLPKLKGNINFWLDGHYSAGITFKGDKDCPVEDELVAIKENLSNFENITILIDDVRCFLLTNNEHSGFPSIDYLVDWARANGFNWRIEQDIFIMRNYS
jgi:hypothetical protein